MAANLGDDADTTAAVCGQIAGAHYGFCSIPDGWVNKLAMKSTIIDLADSFLHPAESIVRSC
jgi:ADP-ribosyl-[dinitrogen reductase] hydrolase